MCISISTSAFSKKIISVVKTLRYKKYITDCFLRDHALQYSKNSNIEENRINQDKKTKC